MTACVMLREKLQKNCTTNDRNLIVWVEAPLKIEDSQDMEAPIRKLDQSKAEAVVFLGKVGLGISSEHLQTAEY